MAQFKIEPWSWSKTWQWTFSWLIMVRSEPDFKKKYLEKIQDIEKKLKTYKNIFITLEKQDAKGMNFSCIS